MKITTSILTNLIARFEDRHWQEILLDEDYKRDKLHRIIKDLLFVIAVLQDKEGRQEPGEVTSELLAEVREIAFTVEDLFDTFILRKKQQKKQNIIVRYTFYIFENLAFRRKFLYEFHVLKSRMTSFDTWGPRLNLARRDEREDTSTDFMDVRRSTPTFGKDYIIGLEDDLKLLKSRLVVDDAEENFFISIVGMGGIGKTTLAKALYNNNDVIKHFDICAWIYVSQESNGIDLIKNICNSLMDSAQSDRYLDQMMIKLEDFCKEKRCLFVLDDVWMYGYEAWDPVKYILRAMGSGSRVLLTTRNREVAFATDSRIHDMKFLTAENSRMLLLEIVGRMETDPPELIELGKKIVSKCGGLPLAIQVVGGLLSRKRRTVSDWSVLLNIDSWHLNETQNSFSSILELSFNDLPSFLMPFFLYLLVFPKDYEIPLRRLYGLWLVEGFLREKNSTDRAEELVEKILGELYQRNMIQVVRWKLDGQPKTFRVPGLLRDTLISRAHDIGFFHNQNSNSGAAQPTSAIRRLVEYTDIHDYSSLERFIENSRSYISFNFRKGDIPAELTGRFLARIIQKRSFGLLGVLDLERVYKPKLPEALGKLHLLKYLGLRWTFLDALPSSVGDLLNLEILDVKHTYISRLPSSIRKMKNLQHLYLNEIHLDLSVCGVALQNLRTLWGLSADGENPIKDNLDSLITLQKLGLTAQDTLVEMYAEWISRLTALETLRFRSQDEYGRPSHLKLGSFSSLSHLHDLYLHGKLTMENPLLELQLPESLTVLTLSVSGLEQDPMPTLEKLPNLRALRLFARSYTGKNMVCSDEGFPSLCILKLWMLEELEEWIIEDGAMIILSELEIRCCKKLKKCPKNMLQLPSLKGLILTNMSKDFVAEVDAGKGDNVSLTLNNWEFPTFPSQDQESSHGGEGSG